MEITIALADDHQLVRKGIRLLIENIGGFRIVKEAGNGRELAEQVMSLDTVPDIVLVDVNMPVMDGEQTVIFLREKYPDLRIIALSVSNELPVIRNLIKAGANAYLFKDSSPETFQLVLREVHAKGFYYDKAVIESLLLDGSSLPKPRNTFLMMLGNLTDREKEFVKHCCSEMTYKEIASCMKVSQRTVDGYRSNAFEKLDVKSRTGIVLFAFQSGLMELK